MTSLAARRSSRVTFSRKVRCLWSDWSRNCKHLDINKISMPLYGAATDHQGMIESSEKCLADSEISGRKRTSVALVKNADERREFAKRRASMALVQAFRGQG